MIIDEEIKLFENKCIEILRYMEEHETTVGCDEFKKLMLEMKSLIYLVYYGSLASKNTYYKNAYSDNFGKKNKLCGVGSTYPIVDRYKVSSKWTAFYNNWELYPEITIEIDPNLRQELSIKISDFKVNPDLLLKKCQNHRKLYDICLSSPTKSYKWYQLVYSCFIETIGSTCNSKFDSIYHECLDIYNQFNHNVEFHYLYAENQFKINGKEKLLNIIKSNGSSLEPSFIYDLIQTNKEKLLQLVDFIQKVSSYKHELSSLDKSDIKSVLNRIEVLTTHES